MNRLLICTSLAALYAAFAASPACAAEANPAVTAASLPATLTGEIQRAKDLREQGHLAEAAKALRQLMLVAGNDPRVVGEYGKVLAQQGYSKDAVGILSKAARLNSADWTLYSALGVAFDQLDDHASARTAYERALAIKPGEPSVVNNYAISRMLTGDYAGAVQMLAQLHSNDPKIVANLSKAEELQAAHSTKTVSAKPPAHLPATAMAALGKASAKHEVNAGVVMQKAPNDPHNRPTRQADRAPRALVKGTAARLLLTTAAAKLNVPPKSIVMQEVPNDPHAGLVKKTAVRTASPLVMAKAAAKPAAKLPPPPALRTASD